VLSLFVKVYHPEHAHRHNWSARDIQSLEMNPLGPFNGKNFMTSIPPWGRHARSVEAIRSCGSRTYATVARFMDDHNSINYSIELGGTILRHGIQSTTCNVGFETMYCTFRHMLAPPYHRWMQPSDRRPDCQWNNLRRTTA
jgi:fumarylacetoacetase